MNLQIQAKPAGPRRRRRSKLRRLFLAFVLLLLIVVGPSAPNLGSLRALAQEPTTEPAAEPAQQPTQEPTADSSQPPAADPAQESTPTHNNIPATPTPIIEATPTLTPTVAITITPTLTPTIGSTPTVTPTIGSTPTATPTLVIVVMPTVTPTVAVAPTLTSTKEISSVPAVTPTATPELTFAVAAAPPVAYTVNLEVREYVEGPGVGALIGDFTYLVNEDNTGDPYDPDPNNHPSLKPMASNSPIVGAGNGTAGTATVGLPDLDADFDRFLISVRAAGYKLWGKHVNENDDGETITIELIPEPLPRSKIRVHVFHDNQSVNGEDDIPVESGLAGFHVVVEDTLGEVTVDWDGNPLCGGYCITDPNGDVIIENLPYGKYEVIAIPPNGSDWVQTTTIEGTHILDAWVEEGSEGYSPREGFQQPAVWIGFVQPMDWEDPGTGTIKGTVKYVVEWTPPLNPITLGEAVYKPWIALTDIGASDQQVYMSRGNADGSFQIDNVPDGEYQIAIWDDNLDALLSFFTVVVANGETVEMGEFGIPRWFGWISGYVFRDDNENALKDPGEPGMANIDLDTRFRDGTIQYTGFTDPNGFYEFPEVFELEKFAIAEVGFGRFHRTGHSVFYPYDINGPHGPGNPEVVLDDWGGGLLLNELTWAAKRTNIDWGKRDYAEDDPNTPEYEGENGGITGIVYYAVTRNEFNARLAVAEDYEPGIPNVTLRLWGPGEDGILNTPDTPSGDDVLLNELMTDAWEHPSDCDANDSNGDPLPDPLNLGPNCVEVPNISNEVKHGAFDGGFAFETMCPGDGFPCNENDELPLTPGDYVVEVVPPLYYQILKEEDQNTDEGNEFLPAFPPAACVGDLHLVNDSRNPYDGSDMPLCNKKLVTLQDQQNPAADFYLFSDNDTDEDATTWDWSTTESIEPAGRIFGFLLDDVNVETDPNFIYYGEKRGIPNTSVGVRDYTGRLITMLTTDENGIFEVILPSTFTANCPIPSGICPGMYRVVGNDPGDPDDPSENFNPNYQTITFIFDVWPGKTTYADVALFPITAFAAFPGSQFGQPALCLVPDDQPQVFVVDPPYGDPEETFTITGAGFDPASEVAINGVALDVTYVSDTQLDVEIPAGFATGPGQLLVTNPNGKVSQTGITYHVGETPAFIVNPGDSIQAAIDAASPGDFIVLTPGLHFGTVNLNKAVTLQGYGPGQDDGFGTGGTVLDQRFILDPVGINVVGTPGQYTSILRPQIDGVRITNARDEQDVGGGLHVDINGQFLIISNNVIQSNGGNFGGGITLGEPYRGDNDNDNIRIHHNRILNNGGFSLAGGIGIFNGAEGYEIDHNEICGNYSGEYGAGISHFGLSQGGHIHHNQIYNNNAFDEGGGILIGGELPQPPATFTVGAGEVDIDHNLIQANMSNDDGGGVRLLQPLDFEINITNNMIVNNVATDFGGGIALDDASNVNIVNNTIARNANTSTSEDANGRHDIPNGAGVAVETYSSGFESYLGIGPGGYVDPVMFNNIICENQAYTWDGTSLVYDSIFDLQVFAGGAGQDLHPTASLLTDPADTAQENFVTHPSNLACGDLTNLFEDTPDATVLEAVPFRMEPDFISVIMVTVPQPLSLQGDYHTQATAVAVDAGADTDPLLSGVAAPCDDFDDDGRPHDAVWDVGADEQPGEAPCVEVPIVDLLYFSTNGNVSIPDVGGPFDNADIYKWDGTSFSRVFDATAHGVGAGANVDGLVVGDDESAFYLSFVASSTTVDGNSVPDEDIVLYDVGADTWSQYFDGSEVGLNDTGSEDVDAFEILSETSLIVSTVGSGSVTGIPSFDNEDLLVCVHPEYNGIDPITSCTWSLYADAGAPNLFVTNENIDGVAMPTADKIYMSLTSAYTGGFEDGDVFSCDGPSLGALGCDSLTMFFDRSAVGIADDGDNDDLNAIDVVPATGGGPLGNLAPIVEAGADQELTWPDDTLTLAGTANDPDAGPVTPLVATWSLESVVPVGGSVSFVPDEHSLTPDVTFTATGSYVLRLEVTDGAATVADLVTIDVGLPPAEGNLPAADLYFSLNNSGAYDVGIGPGPIAAEARNADILGWDGTTGFFEVFDASAVGISGLNMSAFHIVDSGTILMSFSADTMNFPTLGPVDNSDIVQFTATDFGFESTAGTFTLFFDGSAHGLTTSGEAIDAMSLSADGNTLYISTQGTPAVDDLAGVELRDEDILAFDLVGETWSLAFDGSEVGLDGGSEDVKGAAGPLTAGSDLYLTTVGAFDVGLTGADEDVFVCESMTPAPATGCASFSLFFDGSSFGLSSNEFSAIDIFP